jgi:CheY-like chemotaxis protein
VGGGGGGGMGAAPDDVRNALDSRKASFASATTSSSKRYPLLNHHLMDTGKRAIDELNASSGRHGSEDKDENEIEAMEALDALRDESISDSNDYSIGEELVLGGGSIAKRGKSQLEKIFSRFGRRHSSIVGSHNYDSWGGRNSSGVTVNGGGGGGGSGGGGGGSGGGGGGGLTFLEELEARRSMLARQSNLGGGDGLQRRFLIVDDCPITRKVIRRLLLNQGQLVGDAVNGLDCLRVYEEAAERGEKYDVILMDEDMPLMCGSAAAKILRTRGVTVPILGLTGGDTKYVTQLFKESGVLSVLPKPLDMVQLTAELTRYYEQEQPPSPQPQPQPHPPSSAETIRIQAKQSQQSSLSAGGKVPPREEEREGKGGYNSTATTETALEIPV